jgi:outer membrane immunogenic protein
MRNKLLSSVAGAVFSFALSGLAFAADIALKAPAPSPAPVYNWTGWYVGVNAGASFGHVNTDFNNANYTFTVPGLAPQVATFPGAGFSDTAQPDGFMGGGQIGYNWQFSPIWVAGFEADFQGALERDSAHLSQPLGSLPIFENANTSGNRVEAAAVTDYTTKIEWFGTVRVRAGYVWGNGNVFSYLTGGFAYGKVDFEGTNSVSGTLNGIPFFINNAFSHNDVNTGWVAGYGTEGVIDFWGARNWTWKIEGLYMDLGHLDTTGVTTGAHVVPLGVVPIFASGGQVTAHSHFTDGILRGGLNYKFY